MYFPRRFLVTWAPCFHPPTSLLRMWCHRFCQNKLNQGNYLQFLFFFFAWVLFDVYHCINHRIRIVYRTMVHALCVQHFLFFLFSYCAEICRLYEGKCGTFSFHVLVLHVYRWAWLGVLPPITSTRCRTDSISSEFPALKKDWRYGFSTYERLCCWICNI